MPKLLNGQVVHCCPQHPNCDCMEISTAYQQDMFSQYLTRIIKCPAGCTCYSCEVRR